MPTRKSPHLSILIYPRTVQKACPFNTDTLLAHISTVQLNTAFACVPDVATDYVCSSLQFPEFIHEGE